LGHGIFPTEHRYEDYREWLPADGYEGRASVGGSFLSDNIEDDYLTPGDMGCGPFVKSDHDFIGREALEKTAADKHRQKVTLALFGGDVTDGIMSQYGKDRERGKFIDFPSAVYCMSRSPGLCQVAETGLLSWIILIGSENSNQPRR